MSFTGVVLGTIGQLVLGYFLFMLVVFSGGGAANGATPGRWALGILNLSIYLLPGLCVLSAGIVIQLYRHGAGGGAYGWYALPLLATALYLGYVYWLGRGAG